VQITKDAIGDKGPTLTTYLSIPGRYLVLMPSISHRGVSRKIEDSRERKRLKRILDGLSVPEGMGIIARTATMGRTKIEITRDLDYLLSAWNRLAKRLEQGQGPTALYQESDVAIRTVRDLFGPETKSVIIDDHETYKSICDFAAQLMPEQIDRIVEHEGERPLFQAMGVEQDFEKIFARRIELPSGGSIVFDQAEALVAIDINSGKTRTSSHDFEEIALKTNMEAGPEIARQIRLRDLGGIIVVDFIDMMKSSNRKAVEQAFRGYFSDDRARSKVGRISQFGLLEMTRQRLGPGMSKKLFRPCTACRGAGQERTPSSRAAALLRRLGSAITLKGFSKVEVRAHPETIEYLKRARRKELGELEEKSGRTFELLPVPNQTEDSVLRYLRADGREVRPGGRRKR
jgi:ribonuclease E